MFIAVIMIAPVFGETHIFLYMLIPASVLVLEYYININIPRNLLLDILDCYQQSQVSNNLLQVLH